MDGNEGGWDYHLYLWIGPFPHSLGFAPVRRFKAMNLMAEDIMVAGSSFNEDTLGYTSNYWIVGFTVPMNNI